MALIDKASLLMVPSTYEDGTLYNVLPSGNKAPDETGNHNGYDQTRADFTFDRGNNLAATRVNADGLIEKGRENLLLQSNQFDTDWSLTSGSSLTSGQIGYDGTNDSWLLTDSGFAGSYALYQGISNSGVLTASIYAKAASTNVIELDLFGSPSPYVKVDLSTGSITGSTNHIDVQSVDVGNGWYRVSVTGNLSSTSYIRVGCDGAGSIYIQNAQLESGLVATDYIETGATTAKAGILEDMPRIDYTSGTGALLLEGLRTNLLTQSEYFGAWNGFRTDLSANSATSPEGVSNAYSMVPNTDNNTHFIYFNTSESAVDYSFSLFAKSNGQQWIQLAKGGGGYANFDLTNGVKGNYGTDGSSAFTNSDIEDYGNGWYRITAYYTSVGGSSNIGIAAISSDVTGRYQSFAGDGTSGYYIYGAQLESSASYESSYIPTYGSAVSRSADSCSVTGVSDVIGQTEGTLFVEYTASHEGSAGERIFAIGDGTASNRIVLFEASDKIRVYAADGGSVQWDYTTTIDFEGTHKIAVTYAANSAAIYIDGTEIQTDSSFVVPSCNNVYLGTSEAFGVSIGGTIKEAILFDSALTQSEAEALTTL